MLATAVVCVTSARGALDTGVGRPAARKGLNSHDEVSLDVNEGLSSCLSEISFSVSIFRDSFEADDRIEDEGELLSIGAIIASFSTPSGGKSIYILRGLSSIGAMRGVIVGVRCRTYAGLFVIGVWPDGESSIMVVPEEGLESLEERKCGLFRNENRLRSKFSASNNRELSESSMLSSVLTTSVRYGTFILASTSCSSKPSISI